MKVFVFVLDFSLLNIQLLPLILEGFLPVGLILCNLVLQFSWQIFGTDKEGGVESILRGRGNSIQGRLLLQLL